MFKSLPFLLFLVAGSAAGQQAAQEQPPQPQVHLNVVNVCSPSADEQAALKSAMAKVTAKPAFAQDFEISRGRASMKDAPASKFVRLRRDFAPESPFLTAQYSMSIDEKVTIETLVLRLRDPREFHELSIEDRVSPTAASPGTVLDSDTPAARIRLERLGKNSVVLARCPAGDQSAYEPLFKQASEIMASYRVALGLRNTFRSDIAWLDPGKNAGGAHSKQP